MIIKPDIVRLYWCRVCNTGNLFLDEMSDVADPISNRCKQCEGVVVETKARRKKDKKLHTEPLGRTKA
jgi:hypothetical protein